MKQKKEYDMALLSKALTGLTLRVAVSGYIVYLGWKIVANVGIGDSPIPSWGAWLIFAVFAAVAVVFCVFAWKQYLLIRKLAEIPSAPQDTDVSKNQDSGNTED